MPKSTSDCCATGCKRLWPKVRLGDVCDTINGLWKGVKPPFITVGVIRATNFSKNCEFSITPKNTVYIEVEEKKYLKRKLHPGDLIVERSGGGPGQPVGRVVLFDRKDGEFTISNFTSILRIKHGTNIDPMYLQRCLTSFYVRGETDKIQSHTIALHNLDFDAFLDFQIPLPPLAEQKKIVEKVEKALKRVDALKAQFERMEKSAADYFKAALAETFAAVKGEKVKLGDVCETITDGDHQPPPKTDDGVPFLVISNVADGVLDFKATRHVPVRYYEAIDEKRKPKMGDVLLTVTGSFGIPVLVDTDRPFCFQRHIALLRTSKMTPEFLKYLMLAPESVQYFDRVATGAAQRTVSLSSLREMKVTLPQMQSQREVVKRLTEIKCTANRLEEAARRCIGICGKMRKAILAEAFQ